MCAHCFSIGGFAFFAIVHISSLKLLFDYHITKVAVYQRTIVLQRLIFCGKKTIIGKRTNNVISRCKIGNVLCENPQICFDKNVKRKNG